MRLSSLIKSVDCFEIYYNNKPALKEQLNINIKNLYTNSNSVKKNGLFFAINGTKLNGEQFVISAIKKGAVAIVCENFITVKKGIVLIVVKNIRIALSQISAAFYKNAHKKLKIIGITGTNGKSSCGYILHCVFTNLSKQNSLFSCGFIGTNAVFYNYKKESATLTTPDPIQLHQIFYKMVKMGIKICVMEVSSHSIYFNKIYGLNFEILALTNVKSDHLDFFKTQKNYQNQKIALFLNYKAKKMVVNLNDKVGCKIFEKNLKNDICVGFKAYEKHCLNSTNVCQYKELNSRINKTKFILKINNKRYKFSTNLNGDTNLQNLALCFNVLLHFGITLRQIKKCFKRLFIEGRLNIFYYNKKINFVIDYAHTASSTKAVLETIKKLAPTYNNVIVVGAPGNRDEFKRKKTAKICKNFGRVILTADNPKYENPYKIMEEMKKGDKNAILIENRNLAINYAFKNALKLNKKTNIILLGKGVEEYQDYNNKQIAYSDFEAVKRIFQKK